MKLPLSVGALLAIGHAAFGQNPAPIDSFGYGDVQLTGGPLYDQAAFARKFYLDLSEDSLLQGFRLRAHLPAPGKPMGGWYDPDGFAAAHPFGQFVSALARMYAETGDPRFKAKVARLVHGFHETLGPDGYFYASAKVEREWPCYLYDKDCIGMRDAYTLTGNREALAVLGRMTDWAEKHLPARSDEWYTLPENLLNCYRLTGEERYRKMAAKYDASEEFYNKFADGKNAFEPSLHAYSHVNTLCSSARLYEATSNPKYLDATANAWKYLTTTQMYASGGWGPDEHFVPPGKLAPYVWSTGEGFETPCGCYANVNVDRYLLRFKEDGRYGDNMERVLYNGILGALPPLPDGHGFYYSDYRPGAIKVRRDDPWTCCTGTYAQITADYPLDIYFKSGSTLFVNLYVPSKVKWHNKGAELSLAQVTEYPTKLSSRLALHTSRPQLVTLALRIPAWATGKPHVSVNGKAVTSPIVHGFFCIARRWHDGDRVAVSFEAQPRFEPLEPTSPDLAALMLGPVMYVALAKGEVKLNWNTRQAAAQLKRVGDDLLVRGGTLRFRPFYKVNSENYTTYCWLSP
jgi:DUF1680 family protein